MPSFTALYDACVLYPAPLRDLLMRLALLDLFRARWTDKIHDEWIGSLHTRRPELSLENLQRTRKLMDDKVEHCLVTGYEPLIEGLTLPDPDDRHVLAAAIRTHADVIVTFNLRDFPKNCLEQFGIEAQHPDEFMSHLLDLNPGKVCYAVKRQREGLKNPQPSIDALLQKLAQQKLPETVARLIEFKHLL